MTAQTPADRLGAPRKPPRLRPGDAVGLVAPANPWSNRSDLLRGVKALEGWGLRVIGDMPGKHHATVPIGALATLDGDAGTLVVEEVVTADG